MSKPDAPRTGASKKAKRSLLHIEPLEPRILLDAVADLRMPTPSVSADMVDYEAVKAVIDADGIIAQGIDTGFEGISDTGYLPPDPTAAAGVSQLLGAVNDHVALFQKDGVKLQEADFSAFFDSVDHGTDFIFDPWAFYDPYSDRFVLMAAEVDWVAEDAWLLIAVSTDGTPDDLDTAFGDGDTDWYFYSIDSTYNFSGTEGWADYPKIASDADSFYITGNYFDWYDYMQGVVITRLEKTPMLSGSMGSRTDILVPDGSYWGPFAVQPVQSVGRSASDPMLFVESDWYSGTGLRVWELSDSNALTEEATLYSYFDFAWLNGAPQLGGSSTLDVLGDRLMNAVYRDDSIYTALTIDQGGTSIVRWFEIDTTGGMYSLAQVGEIDPGNGAHTFMPAIGVDAAGNMAITYTQSSSTQYAAMMMTAHMAGDADGTTQTPIVVRAGDAYYNPSGYPGAWERWGDYGGLSLDPSDDTTFWAFHEYPATTNTWGTYWAGYTVTPPAPGEIHGTIWYDTNGDGVKDVDEDGLENWSVWLDDNSNYQIDAGELSTTTAADGTYSFLNVPAGTHYVTEELPDGWELTYAGISGAGMIARDPIARAAGLAATLTTTGSDVEVRAAGIQAAEAISNGEVTALTNWSGPLISIDDFRADPRFAGIDGTGYSVVILDTGIDLDHPFFGVDLDSNGIADRIVYQYDFINGDSSASDLNGHGSNVSSIVGSEDGTYTGMAPGVNLIHLQVLDQYGSGTYGAIELALQWVVANAAAYNIASVNMSLGDGGNYSSAQSLYGIGDELAALDALDVIVCSASGNDYYWYSGAQGVSYPAADPNSLSVGAVWDGNNGAAYWFSGAIDYTTDSDRITSFSQRDDQLTDIMAPGAMITGAYYDGTTVAYGGTSQASPHIAGIAALAQQLAVRDLGRRLTMDEFRQLLATSGVIIFDGDDEDDNVPNSGLQFPRVDVLALGEAIYAMGDRPVAVQVVTVNPGEIVTGVDFGNRLEGLVTIDMQAGSDTGESSIDDLTNDTTPTFDVTVADAGTIEIDWDDDGVIDTAQVANNYGTYSFTAPAYADGTHTVSVTFTSAVLGSQNAELPIIIDTTGPTVASTQMPSLLFEDTFSVDTGWTGYVTDQWERGPAVAGGGSYGYPDPGTDTSAGNDNYILGYNLGGDYTNAIATTRWITSPVIDASNVSDVVLNFQRWLNVEDSYWDHVYLDVFNGFDWQTIFTNSGSVTDDAWQDVTFDASSYADDNSNFRIRFGLGTTDFSVVYSGWNIDDVIVSGLRDLAGGVVDVAVDQFAVVFDDLNGMDESTVTDVANYTLTGSGGDGIFGNGNDVDHSGLITSITYDATTGKATVKLSTPLLDEDYRLTINGTTSVKDKAGNSLNDGADDVTDFEVDTQGAQVTIDMQDASDAGSSMTDNITNVTAPTFDFTINDQGTLGIDWDGDGTVDESHVLAVSGTHSYTAPVYADGSYSVAAVFTDTDSDIGTGFLDIVIDTQGPTVSAYAVEGRIFQDTFTTDTGWTGYSNNQWERASATAGTVTWWGYPDPSYDTTTTSDNMVLGYNIGGDYQSNLSDTVWITSPVIDASQVGNVRMDFQRWLNVDYGYYDHAYIQAWDGSDWQTVFENAGYDYYLDGAWQQIEYDLSTYAAGNPNFQVRFGMGETNSSYQLSGWNVDDLSIYGWQPMGTEVDVAVTSFDVTFEDGSEIDAATATFKGNYRIIGSGGDGTFNDGNETILTGLIDTITWDAASSTARLTLSAALADETYRFEVVGTTSVKDVAGNSLNDGADDTREFVQDTSTPIVLLDLVTASDTGASSVDNITMDRTPTYRVTVNNPGTLRIDWNGDGTADLVRSIGAAGSYTYTAPTLADGTYNVTATFADSVLGTFVDSVVTTIDTVAPGAPDMPDLQAASDTGESYADNITYNTAPVIGISGFGNYYRLERDGDQVSADYASASSLTDVGLSDGQHFYRAYAVDIAGNQSVASDVLGIIVDTVAPTVVSAEYISTITAGIGQESLPPHIAVVFNDANSMSRVSMGSAGNFALFSSGGDGAFGDGYDIDLSARFGTPSYSEGIQTVRLPVTPVLGEELYRLIASGGISDAAGNLLNAGTSAIIDITVDNQMPTLDIALQTTSDSGVSDRDHITNDSTPTFDVTINEPGTLEISWDGVGDADVTAVLNAAGTYTFTPNPALSDGSYRIEAIFTDTANNVITDSDPTEIDSAAPVAPSAPDLLAGSDSGESSSDNLTTDTTPTLYVPSGSDYFRLYRDNVLISGSWSAGLTYTETNLPNGTYGYTLRAVDTAGNQSAVSAGLDVTIDTVGPSVTQVTPNGTVLTNPTQLTVDFSDANALWEATVTDTSNYMLVQSGGDGAFNDGNEVDRSAWISSISYDGGTQIATLNLSVALPNEAYQLTVDGTSSVRDSAGTALNGGASDHTASFIVSSSAPIVFIDLQAGSDTGVSDSDNITNASTPWFDVTISGPGTVRIDWDGDGTYDYTTTEVAGGTYSYQPAAALPEGTLNTKVEFENLGLFTDDDTLTVTLDNTAPGAPIAPALDAASDTGVAGNGVTSDLTPTFDVNAAGDYWRLYRNGVLVSQVPLAGDDGGVYREGLSETLGLQPLGTYTYTARAVDAAGNESVDSVGAQVTYQQMQQIGMQDYGNGVTVYIFDTDTTNGVSAPNIAWYPRLYQRGTSDILINPGTVGTQMLGYIILYGDGSRTQDLGILVMGGDGVNKVVDARSAGAAPLGVLYSEGGVNVSVLRRGVAGANINGFNNEGGTVLPVDIDNDGNTLDDTAFYSGGTGGVLLSYADLGGDVVANYFNVLTVINGRVAGDIRSATGINVLKAVGYIGPNPIIQTVTTGGLLNFFYAGGDVGGPVQAGAITKAIFAGANGITNPVTTVGGGGTDGRITYLRSIFGPIANNVTAAGHATVIMGNGISGNVTAGNGITLLQSTNQVSGNVQVTNGNLDRMVVVNRGGTALSGQVNVNNGSLTSFVALGSLNGAGINVSNSLVSMTVVGNYNDSQTTANSLSRVLVTGAYSDPGADDAIIRSQNPGSVFYLFANGFWNRVSAGNNHVNASGVDAYVG